MEERLKTKRLSKPFLLIDTFADVWSRYYSGEIYEKSPADFKQAKLYLDLNEDFSPDNIVAKAQIYLTKDGYYKEIRHSFKAFINNIGSFVDEMPGKNRVTEGQHWMKLLPRTRGLPGEGLPTMRRRGKMTFLWRILSLIISGFLCPLAIVFLIVRLSWEWSRYMYEDFERWVDRMTTKEKK